MLIRYKKNVKKIAMGLLSFMPDEKKDVKKLQEYIQEYESNPDWHLYLWKDKEDDILGIIGVRIDNEVNVVIQDLSVNPSHRNMGIGKKMINEINQLYGKKYTIFPTEEIKDFYKKYEDAENL